nr:glycosyltransferase [uncultured Flavobacterium sp.]
MINDLPLISIIIPCYNDWQYVEEAVNSALNQTYSNIEVIVVDDGSNIETKVVLKRLEPKITKLITQENKGQSTARNVGIREAKGEYILVLDSDDFFEPSFSEEAVRVLSSDNSIKIVTSHLRRFIDDKTIDIFIPSGGDITTFILENGATGSAMFRKSEALAIGGYDEQMRTGFEDWEFYIRLLKDGGITTVLEKTYLNYRIRVDSTTSRANQVKVQLLHYIYKKNSMVFLKHIDIYVSSLFGRIEKLEKEKIKLASEKEFKVGLFILKPLRFIKFLIYEKFR